tara:strand:+ start:712 stop:2772 length:2061 start_codon:yes stop_codon:yes gene_type:complete
MLDNNTSELHPELMGLGNNLDPFGKHNSASRRKMFASHLSQALVIEGSTPKRIQTGAERELGKYTKAIEMPVDASIIKVIQRYPRRPGADSIKENPTTAIIYENIETQEVDILLVENYCSDHNTFGFQYHPTSALEKIYAGMQVPKGTILAKSKALKDDGNYAYGLEANVAYMTLPATIEDGFIISESMAERLTTTMTGSRVVSWGKEYYPLNLYGDKDNYKPFPDIGDKIREDGLLIALRKYDPALGMVEMTPKALMTPDYTYDKLTYVAPAAGATVYDVIVDMDHNLPYSNTPVGMNAQPDKYLRLSDQFYDTIYNEYRRLAKQRGKGLQLSPALTNIVTRAIANKPNSAPHKVTQKYRYTPLDDRRVEIKYAKKVKATKGFKLTDSSGSKGVVVDIWPTENMPVGQNGLRAEVIMDPISPVKRINLSQLYEQYVNATSHMVVCVIKELMSKGQHQQAWEYLKAYYSVVSPPMIQTIEEVLTNDRRIATHLDIVAEHGIYLYLPVNSEHIGPELITSLVDKFPVDIQPVTYSPDGVTQVTTADPVLIGSKYMMLLEAAPDNWSSVSTAKLQHHGLPAKASKSDRYGSPNRELPVRIMGEDEVRLFNAAVGPELTTDLLDGSASPMTQKEIIRSILNADSPSNIEQSVNRRKVPLGRGRSHEYVNHLLSCAGVKFVRGTYDHDKD